MHEYYAKCSKWRPLVSTRQCIRLCHWSTASSIVVAETRESVVGYQATRVRCPSTKLENKKAELSQRWPLDAPYTRVLWKFSWVPDYVNGYFSRSFNGLFFRLMLRICEQTLKFVALPVPEIIGDTQKMGSAWIRPRSLLPIFNWLLFGWTLWMFLPNLKFVASSFPEIIAIGVLGGGCEP